VAKWLCRAATEVPGVEAWLLGDGSDRAAAEAIIRSSGTTAVRTAGHVDSDDVQARLRQAHVIVLLSDYEGLPIAVLEAMACGLVPVCTRIRSGVPELVEDEVTGLLVDPDPGSFVRAVSRLRSEPGLWARLSRNARELAASQFSLDVMASGWRAALVELREAARPTGRISAPLRLGLTPVRPALAGDDARKPRLVIRSLRRLRRTVGPLVRPVRDWLVSG
jgi:glycosyltransferase involved in cell wall biosynthesis